MQNIKKLLFLLTAQEIKISGLLLLMVLVMALLDTLGVASILPFITVLTNPDLIETNSILNYMFQFSKIFGVENNQDFLFSLGVLVFVLLVISISFKAFTAYVQLRFISMCEYSISKRLVEKYLHQPYDWFLGRHSADLGKTILTEVGIIVGGCLKPLLDLIAKSIVVFALITLLVLAEPKLALTIGFTLGMAYVVIYYLIRNIFLDFEKKRLKCNELRFKAVSEAFGCEGD